MSTQAAVSQGARDFDSGHHTNPYDAGRQGPLFRAWILGYNTAKALADPDSDAARLAAHRRLHSLLPEGHTAPPSAAEERMREAALYLTQALGLVDRIAAGASEDVSYETMQRARFNRPTGWRRKYTLKDAKAHARSAARDLRKAWEFLDPSGKNPFDIG